MKDEVPFKLETGHVIRRKDSNSKTGEGTVLNRESDKYGNDLDSVRVMWIKAITPGIFFPIERGVKDSDLEVRVRVGRKLVWKCL